MTEEKHVAEWLRERSQLLRTLGDFSCRDLMTYEFGISSPCTHPRSCRDCYADMFERIADRIDAERTLPEGVEWPRFEDGGLVRIGDDVKNEGETMRVYLATFDSDGWALWCSREGIDGRLSGSYGERVKRPAPEFIDADGVPIKVGDTVYCDGEDEPLRVSHITDSIKVTLIDDHASYYTVKPSRLSHEPPDSWEKLEEDADKCVCEYAGAQKSIVDDDKYSCINCPYDEPGSHTDKGCQERMRLDLVRRAKKLAGIEEEARND